jgi:hypothetical protein
VGRGTGLAHCRVVRFKAIGATGNTADEWFKNLNVLELGSEQGHSVYIVANAWVPNT